MGGVGFHGGGVAPGPAEAPLAPLGERCSESKPASRGAGPRSQRRRAGKSEDAGGGARSGAGSKRRGAGLSPVAARGSGAGGPEVSGAWGPGAAGLSSSSMRSPGRSTQLPPPARALTRGLTRGLHPPAADHAQVFAEVPGEEVPELVRAARGWEGVPCAPRPPLIARHAQGPAPPPFPEGCPPAAPRLSRVPTAHPKANPTQSLCR